MICQTCGANIPENSQFCQCCGIQVTRESYPPQSSCYQIQNPYQQPQYNFDEVSQPFKMTSCIILLCTSLFSQNYISLIFAVIALAMRSGSKNNPDIIKTANQMTKIGWIIFAILIILISILVVLCLFLASSESVNALNSL